MTSDTRENSIQTGLERFVSKISSTSFLTTLLVSFLASLFLNVMGFFSSKNHFVVDGKTAIITGGSQGLGLAAAKLLASKGANVVIVAQDLTKLAAAEAEIKKAATRPDQRFLHLSFDLRDPDSAPTILSQVTQWNHDVAPQIVWSCAGHCIPGFFAESSITNLRAQMDTLYWSCAYMAHATLNQWLQHPPPKSEPSPSPTLSQNDTRHIIFTSSTLAFFPVAGYAPYTPAKAAMRALSDTLVQEVALHNAQYNHPNNIKSSAVPSTSPLDIQIHTVFPMGILSPGYEHENTLKPRLTQMLEKDDKPQTPEEVARIAVQGLERGQYLITTMFLGHLLRGVGMGASVRNGLVDLFWSVLGGVAIWFVTPDFVGKCAKWGREHGRKD